MPSKKSNSKEPAKSTRITAPDVPENLLKQVKVSQTEDTSLAERITVRRSSSKKPDTVPPAEPDPDIPPTTLADDAETDKAVDDIMAKESDTVLAVDDALAAKRSGTPNQSSWRDKLLNLVKTKWFWIICALIVLVFALPYSRYRLLGFVIKENVRVTVIDSQSHTSVSNALVTIANDQVKTDANGVALVRVSIGSRSLKVSKQYYQTLAGHYFVGFKSNQRLSISLVATGRLVPITITNTITSKPVVGATIHVLDTSAKTNASGQAFIAIPTAASKYSATISLNGYNTKTADVVVTSSVVSANSFQLTPSGSVYFLSASTDVMKTDLDGTNRSTVLAATGHETAATTRLIVSTDWHYLVLEANRDGTRPALYLIDTSNNQVTEFDTSDASYKLLGWYGHNFLYSLKSNTLSQWQSNRQVVKEYNADLRQLNQLDQNRAVGTSSSYAYQDLANIFLVRNELIYGTQWLSQGSYDISSQTDTIRLFQLNSQTKIDAASFPASSTDSFQATQTLPQTIYFAAHSTATNSTTYYLYANQTIQTVTSQVNLAATYPSFVPSPSGNRTAWANSSGGQNQILVGDGNGSSGQQIAASSKYEPYGWYGDSYVILAQNNDQLYIVSANGPENQTPYKITAYHEPASSSNYEYGGY